MSGPTGATYLHSVEPLDCFLRFELALSWNSCGMGIVSLPIGVMFFKNTIFFSSFCFPYLNRPDMNCYCQEQP